MAERSADNRQMKVRFLLGGLCYSGSLAVKPAPYKREIVGSNPTRSTKGKDMAKDSETTKIVYMVLEFLAGIALLVFVYFAFCK